jgi:hypothetical protein
MRVYQVARKSPSVLIALTGLRKSEFDRLVLQFQHYINFSKVGRKHNLAEIEHALFFIIFYYRHYCIQELMAFIFRVDQAQISRWIKLLELPFARCTKQYIDKARNKIDSIQKLKEYVPELDAIIDATERPLISHTKHAKLLISGKKKTYTVKNQLSITRKTKEIVHVSKTVQGARHDMHRSKSLKMKYHLHGI